jgi:BlaI family transcriptional regulator, penicillinase repressor
MKRKSFNDLGPLQRSVLELVWEWEGASAHQIRDHLSRKKKLAYTTVLSALQKLEKAGWLKHRPEGRVYIYSATQSRTQAGAGSVKRFLKQVFSGDALAVFQHLIQETELSPEELSQLKEMIKEKERKP